jgi:hypothetical protein
MRYNKTKLIYITLNSSNYLNKNNYDHFETLMIMPWWNQIESFIIWTWHLLILDILSTTDNRNKYELWKLNFQTINTISIDNNSIMNYKYL